MIAPFMNQDRRPGNLSRLRVAPKLKQLDRFQYFPSGYTLARDTARQDAVLGNHMKKTLAILVAAFALAGCQTVPPINFSVPNVGYSAKKIDAELKSMTVSIARADEKTGDLPAGMETLVPQLWQTSLQEALNKMAVFNDDASNKVNLTVKILKLDIPSFGAGMTTEVAARYEILDRKTGAIIFTQDINSKGEVPFDYAFAGVTRARESINRSVQNNITQFLQALQTVDVSKPMFPVKVSQQ